MVSPNRKHLAIAILAVVSVAVTSTAAVASTTSARRPGQADRAWHHVTWTNTAPPIAIGAPQCSKSGQCLYPFTEAGVSSGDLNGTYLASGVATVNASGDLTVSRMDTFTGTIKGCGNGTIVARATEDINAASAPGHWRVVDNFGTGNLAEVHGFGRATGGQTSTGLTSTLSGDLQCRPVVSPKR